MPLRDRTHGPVITHRVAYGRPGRPPQRLDYFEITSSSIDGEKFPVDEQAHANLSDARFGDRYRSDKPRRIPIRVDSDDIDEFLHQQYECRIKKDGRVHLWCSGDGIEAQRKTRDGDRTIRCSNKPESMGGQQERVQRDLVELLKKPGSHDPADSMRCPFAQNRDPKAGPKCDPVTNFIFRCDAIGNLGGRARFRSHSHATADRLRSSLLEIRDAMPGGILAHVPLDLCMTMKTMVMPNGRTTKQPVAHVELRCTFDEAIALISTKLQAIGAAEQDVRNHRLLTAALHDDVPDDVVEAEFTEDVFAEDKPSTMFGGQKEKEDGSGTGEKREDVGSDAGGGDEAPEEEA